MGCACVHPNMGIRVRLDGGGGKVLGIMAGREPALGDPVDFQ